jgi:hypothetical protein
VTVTPLADILAEARRILVHGGGTPLRLLGGAAVALAAPDGVLLPRVYKDIDFVTGAGCAPEAVRAFDELGYVGDQRFNGLNGHRRLLFFDTANGRQVDVFVAKFEMCHVIPLAKRLALNTLTIPLADLLLTKLQIFALNEKDRRDIVNLMHAHPLGEADDEGMINAGYVAALLAGDWGLWRTVMLNIERVHTGVADYGLEPEQAQIVQARLDELRGRIDAEPKSAKWKVRARVGDRVKWYDEPEEVG